MIHVTFLTSGIITLISLWRVTHVLIKYTTKIYPVHRQADCLCLRKRFELTFGDAYRDPRVHGEFGEKESYAGKNSVHKIRLAVDFNLFIDGQYITDSEAYRELGDYWKTLDDLARWGGDFSKPDGNHFSFTYWGAA